MIARFTLVPAGRACYRLANQLIVADRMIRRSRGRGVKMVVEGHDDKVLLVRHTYGNRHWTFPGGRVRRDETTAACARRELEEELGLTPPALRELGSYPMSYHRRTEVIEVYHARCQAEQPQANPIEIGEFAWFDIHDLPQQADPNVLTSLGLLAGRRAEQAAASGRRPA